MVIVLIDDAKVQNCRSKCKKKIRSFPNGRKRSEMTGNDRILFDFYSASNAAFIVSKSFPLYGWFSSFV